MWRTGHLQSPSLYLSTLALLLPTTSVECCSLKGRLWEKPLTIPSITQNMEGCVVQTLMSVWASAEQSLCCTNCSRSARGALSIWTWTFLEKTGLLPTSKGVWAANVKGNQFLTLWKSGSCFLLTPVSCFGWHPSTHWLTAKRRFHWTCWPCVIDLSTDQPKRLG